MVITYNPAGLRDPVALIATFAHELAHYLTACFQEPPPGGWDEWEYATDMAAVFLGFGIFAANSSFTFSQYTSAEEQGWEARRLGYLSEPELLHALALFAALAEIPAPQVLAHLKPSLRKMYLRACAEVATREPELQRLREIRPAAAPAEPVET